jgi:dienelactone hydrolase
MMKSLLVVIVFSLLHLCVLGQKKAGDFGYTHIQYIYKSDTVDILVKSKKGEEQMKKPLFFFCQGSLPQPLIKYDAEGPYGLVPFNEESLLGKYHLVVVGKPYIPLACDVKSLGQNMVYLDEEGKFPKEYSDRNFLSYYVNRNIEVIKFLQEQDWVSKTQLVVAGHSEGSTIAAKMASVFPAITRLIYSGGNPAGRILSVIQQDRSIETDSTKYAEEEIAYWQRVVEDKDGMDTSYGDTNKATYEFSYPPYEYLVQLDIPVLVCYGTKDWCAPYVDFIRKGKKNVQFNAYIGTEHNFFPLKENGRPDYDVFNWDKVANDWRIWLNECK